MAGNRRHDSPGTEVGTGGFLARWSARKCAPAATRERPGGDAAPADDVRVPGDDTPQPVLTDQDMPPLDTLNEDSDYSGFFSEGVSEALRRLALRKLFRAAKFGVRDGLDDYDADYHRLTTLPGGALGSPVPQQVAQHIRHAAVAAGRASESTPQCAAAEQGGEAGAEADTGPVRERRPPEADGNPETG